MFTYYSERPKRPKPKPRPKPVTNCAGCGATHDKYACPYCGRLHSNGFNIAHEEYDECLPEPDFYSNPDIAMTVQNPQPLRRKYDPKYS